MPRIPSVFGFYQNHSTASIIVLKQNKTDLGNWQLGTFIEF